MVAEDVESDALAMLILNKHRAGLKVMTCPCFQVSVQIFIFFAD